MSEREMIRDLWQGMYGDHSDNRPGLFMRFDRVERKVAGLMWGVVVIGGVILTAAAKAAWAAITLAPKP